MVVIVSNELFMFNIIVSVDVVCFGGGIGLVKWGMGSLFVVGLISGRL